MLTNKQYWRIWILAIVFVIVLALIDISTMNFWNLEITQDYAKVFWTFTFIAVALSCVTYYIFKRDKSEAVAIGVIFYGLIYSGLEDVLFFIIRDRALPASMEHLLPHTTIGFLSRTFNMETVTPLFLIITLIIGSFITYKVSKYLIRKM